MQGGHLSLSMRAIAAALTVTTSPTGPAAACRRANRGGHRDGCRRASSESPSCKTDVDIKNERDISHCSSRRLPLRPGDHAVGTSPSRHRLHRRYCCLFLGRSGLYPGGRALGCGPGGTLPSGHARRYSSCHFQSHRVA